MSSVLCKHRGKNRKETIIVRCSSQNTQNRGQIEANNEASNILPERERPSHSLRCLVLHNCMATGWDLSCWNIIRNVPLSLCDPSYTLLFSPLFALSSSIAPSFSAFFLLACSPWQQTFPGGFSGHWGSGGGFLGPLPSFSLSPAQLQPQHWFMEWERVRESKGKMYQNTQASEFHSVIMNRRCMQLFH